MSKSVKLITIETITSGRRLNISLHGFQIVESDFVDRCLIYAMVHKVSSIEYNENTHKRTTIFEVKLAKVLKLRSFNRTFCPNCREGEGQYDQIMVRNHFW